MKIFVFVNVAQKFRASRHAKRAKQTYTCLTLMRQCAIRKIAKLRCPPPLLSVSNYVRWRRWRKWKKFGRYADSRFVQVDPVMQLTDTSLGRNCCEEEMSNSEQWVLHGGLNNNIDWIGFLEGNCRSTPGPFLSSKWWFIARNVLLTAWETEIDMKHPHYTLFESIPLPQLENRIIFEGWATPRWEWRILYWAPNECQGRLNYVWMVRNIACKQNTKLGLPHAKLLTSAASFEVGLSVLCRN